MERYRYFLKTDWSDWAEVTRETWINAERGAGFRPKGGGSGMATGGFRSSSGVSGRLVSLKPDGTFYLSTSEHYKMYEPEFYALFMKTEGDGK